MSIYKKIATIGPKFIPKATLFKYGFNWSPMYKRSTAKIIAVSEDISEVKIKLSLNWKNRNYVNSIFGGSMFAAVDPIPMTQLLNVLGDDYIIWDKSAEINFKRPAKETIYADFTCSFEEVSAIKQRLKTENEIEIVKTTELTNKEQSTIFCVVHKTIYITTKAYYKIKMAKKQKII